MSAKAFKPAAIPLALYIHIPWCIRKCPYCDFNSHQLNGDAPEQPYIDALLTDLKREYQLANGREISSIFFGGGTPSLFSAKAIAQIIDGVANHASLASDAEITLEANPGTFEQARFSGFKLAGVNRLSIGIQSFNQLHLQKLGRVHSADEALKAADIARQAGIDNFNLDLMYALPEQNVQQALADIEQAIELQPTHISHYQLMLEANTQFAKYPPPLPEDDLAWEMQLQCQNLLAKNGYRHYETSAYAKENRQCQHNLNYWGFGDYIGIGAGAHGKLTQDDGSILRRCKKKEPNSYIAAVQTRTETTESNVIETDALPFEYMLNRLRLMQPFSMNDYCIATGDTSGMIDTLLSTAIEKGLLEKQNELYRKTEAGENFLTDLMAIFLKP